MKIKVIDLNLFEGGLYFDNTKKFLKEENPDILCLQEVYDGKDKELKENLRTLEVLKKFLPSFYYHFAPEMLYIRKEGKFPLGNAIFSKFPIVKTNVTFYDIPYGEYNAYLQNDNKFDFFSTLPKNLQYAQINLNGLKLNVFNTHGIWGRHGDDTKRRLEMGKTIVSQIANKDNVILTGDFNLFPQTQTVKNLEKYLKNVFANKLRTSFNVKLKPHPGNYANSVVDMMFVSKDVKVLEKYCPNVDVSDHFPLVSVLEAQTF